MTLGVTLVVATMVATVPDTAPCQTRAPSATESVRCSEPRPVFSGLFSSLFGTGEAPEQGAAIDEHARRELIVAARALCEDERVSDLFKDSIGVCDDLKVLPHASLDELAEFAPTEAARGRAALPTQFLDGAAQCRGPDCVHLPPPSRAGLDEQSTSWALASTLVAPAAPGLAGWIALGEDGMPESRSGDGLLRPPDVASA